MGRLIDADELKKCICRWMKPNKPDENEMIDVCDALVSVMMEIEEQPTAYDVDKVVEQLEDYYEYDTKITIASAIDIVQKGWNE